MTLFKTLYLIANRILPVSLGNIANLISLRINTRNDLRL